MRFTRAKSLLSLLVVFTAACGKWATPTRAPEASLRLTGVGANADPTVRPARILPSVVDDAPAYGIEPGGGSRAVTAGLRVVTTKEGGIAVSEDRLPQTPQSIVLLPERLGGGFLFVLGTSLWRAEHWLDPAKPIFSSLSMIQAVVPGLDRVYLRAQNAYIAVDGKTGSVLDLGPWPLSPFVSAFAAADGWRAVAITDLRGVVATFDAGASWRALDFPLDARSVLVSGDSLVVGGHENGHVEAWFEVRADGSIARLTDAPPEARGRPLPTSGPAVRTYLPGGTPGGYPGGFSGGVTIRPASPAGVFVSPPAAAAGRDESMQDAGSRIFGKRPLASAIEDGWPLSDGTALVARDGALGRIRLSDGALTDVAHGAFPLKPSRCHPISLSRATAVGAFGFICGEPQGASVIYAYDSLRGRLTELKHFSRPRVVTSSGNGAIAVRGSCAEDGGSNGGAREPTPIEWRPDAGADKRTSMDEAEAKAKHAPEGQAATPEVHAFCVFGHDDAWREIHVRGDVGGERVTVLADGRIVVVSPPQNQAAVSRITLVDKGRATTLPVVFPPVAPDIARVLRLGTWLDGFEERRPGVVGGWIEAGGAVLGLEIALDGKATLGQFIRDAGMPFVSGRYGLGWTQSRRGFETTDGGMTWASIELPEPLMALTKVERRACGPVGCLAAGWLRVGWGETKKVTSPALPPPYRAGGTAAPPQLALTCEPTTPSMPTPANASKPTASIPPIPQRPSFNGPPVLRGIGLPGGNADASMPAFFAQPAPVIHDSDRGIPFEVRELPERYPTLGTLARVYTWGPKAGDWDTQGKWQVRWLSPFAGWTEARTSLSVLPPQPILELARAASPTGYGAYYGGSGSFQIASGDDAAHALLLVRSATRGGVTPMELEADRAPAEVRRADGEPFVEIEAVTRAGGRWFIATPPAHGALPMTTIWQTDGAVARELARIPRVIENVRPGTKIARRSDGRAIGLVVDGQATADRSSVTRWVVPIDLDSGHYGEPEALGYSDLAGDPLDACTDDLVGWVFDVSLTATSVRLKLPRGAGSMHSVVARVRRTSTRACVERVAGMLDRQSAESAAQLTRGVGRGPAPSSFATPLRSGEIIASAFAAQARYPLRCVIAK